MVLGDVAAARDLDLAEVLGERHLLIVADGLAADDQHRIAVHAGVDRRGLGLAQRLGQIGAEHLAGENRCGFDGSRACGPPTLP